MKHRLKPTAQTIRYTLVVACDFEFSFQLRHKLKSTNQPRADLEAQKIATNELNQQQVRHRKADFNIEMSQIFIQV